MTPLGTKIKQFVVCETSHHLNKLHKNSMTSSWVISNVRSTALCCNDKNTFQKFLYPLCNLDHDQNRVRTEIWLVFHDFPGQNYFIFQTFQGILYLFIQI